MSLLWRSFVFIKWATIPFVFLAVVYMPDDLMPQCITEFKNHLGKYRGGYFGGGQDG